MYIFEVVFFGFVFMVSDIDINVFLVVVVFVVFVGVLLFN